MTDLPDDETLRHTEDSEMKEDRTPDQTQADFDADQPAERAFDAEWWMERETILDRRVKAVVTTYRVGNVSVSTRVEFE